MGISWRHTTHAAADTSHFVLLPPRSCLYSSCPSSLLSVLYSMPELRIYSFFALTGMHPMAPLARTRVPSLEMLSFFFIATVFLFFFWVFLVSKKKKKKKKKK